MGNQSDTAPTGVERVTFLETRRMYGDGGLNRYEAGETYEVGEYIAEVAVRNKWAILEGREPRVRQSDPITAWFERLAANRKERISQTADLVERARLIRADAACSAVDAAFGG